MANLIHMSMDDIVGNADSTITRHETENITKRKLPIELGADVLHSSKIALAEHILVVIWVGGASVNWERGRRGEICKKSPVDRFPINGRIGGGDGLLGVGDRGEDGGSRLRTTLGK